MSNNDRIQLKREEVVGEDVVLSDINPKTDTHSVDDLNSGVPLDETLDRMWNAINNKLSRVVNSWNGRTGAVIATAEDVGLGNVDNVSFADIKDWVINRLETEFETKRIHLFENLNDVERFCGIEHQGDEAYGNIPFYSQKGYVEAQSPGALDYRGWVGYIYYDAEHSELTHTEMPINSIGWTDNSLVYNQTLHDLDPNVPDKVYDEPGGGLGVNIWKYEDALELYNAAGSKVDSGLRIKKEKIVANVYYFDGVYGNGDASDEDAFLYFDTSTMPASAKPITIKFGGVEISSDGVHNNFGGINYIRQDMKLGDIVICNFSDQLYTRPNPNGGPIDLTSDVMNPVLMNREPAIGKITKAPTLDNPNENFEIDFYPIRPNIYRGLKMYETHTEQMPGIDSRPAAIGVGILEAEYGLAGEFAEKVNVAGLNAFGQYTANNPRTSESNIDRVYQTVLPTGLSSDIFSSNKPAGNQNSSTYILPNFSMCVIPRDAYTGNNNQKIPNWPIDGPDTIDPCTGDEGYKQSLLGVNLEKYVHVDDSENPTGDHYAVNLSGLRVNDDSSPLTGEWFGNPTGSSVTSHSGGLSVNVGKFMEIGLDDAIDQPRTDKTTYYDDGKVNVRVDVMKGLGDTGSNELGIKLCDVDVSLAGHHRIGGLTFTVDNPTAGSLTINPGPGVYLTHDYGTLLNGTGYALLTGIRPPDWPTSATPSTKYFKNIGTAEEPNYVGVTSSDVYVANTYYEYVGVDSPLAPVTENTALTIGIVDTLNTAMYQGNQPNERKKYYGGLRFATIPQSSIPGTSCVSIRVNDSDKWYGNNNDDPITSSPTDLTNLQRGTKGLCIDPDTNVLGIMCSQTHENGNVLHIKSLRQAAEEYISGKVFMAKSSMIYATTASFPATGETDRLYITYENGYPEHYVWDETNGTYEHFIILINTTGPWVANESVIQRMRNRLYMCVNGSKSGIFSYGLMKNVFYPDANSDDQVTADELGVALSLLDLTADVQHEILNNEMFSRLDLNKDGVITQDDVNLINNYISSRTSDNYAEFEEYMRDKGYINPQPSDPENWYYLNASFVWTIHNSSSGDPGLYHNISEGAGVDANMYGGIRTSTNGILTTSNASGTREVPLSRINLEVNIDDRTSRKGIWEHNRYTAGGLRFGTGGVLAVRINNEARYNNIDGSGLDELHRGTKGLCIDENNVLGIQCAPGETAINTNGQLAVFNRFIVDYEGDNVQYKANTLLVDRTNATAPDIYLALQDFYSTTIAGDVANGNIVKIAQTITS